MTGNNPVDRSKFGTKRHILTDKKGIPLLLLQHQQYTHDVKVVTDVLDNAVVLNRPFESSFIKKVAYYHLGVLIESI